MDFSKTLLEEKPGMFVVDPGILWPHFFAYIFIHFHAGTKLESGKEGVYEGGFIRFSDIMLLFVVLA